MTIAFTLLGLVSLVWGAEQLVRGGTALSDSLGVPPLLVGLTVLAFGTSAPEAAVGVFAALSGEGSLALGNVLGSNIFNVLLILGVSAAIRPLAVSRDVICNQVTLVVAASVFAYLLLLDGVLDRVDGGILVAGIGLFTYHQWRRGTKSEAKARPIAPAKRIEPFTDESAAKGFARAAIGLGLLVLGARWLVSGALAAATTLGLPPVVAGLTIVAVGTSLPELVTSALASLRGRADLAVGNVLGSNMFNLLFVLGSTGMVAPQPVEVARYAITFDGPVMIAAAVACLPVFFTGREIARWEGVVFLAYAAAYLWALYLRATGGAAPASVIWVGVAISGSLVVLTAVTVGARVRREASEARAT